jgi:hypothetical protein
MTAGTELLLIGGRSGVGKSSVGAEIHAQLSAARVRHCLIEGDNLDMAYPPPQEHGLTEQNLAAMRANYAALGYRRMIYANTASVLAKVITDLTAATGGTPRVTAVLLRCTSATAHQRLSQREIGTALDWHLERGAEMARRLDQDAPPWVHRLDTDGQPVAGIAAQIIALADWAAQ